MKNKFVETEESIPQRNEPPPEMTESRKTQCLEVTLKHQHEQGHRKGKPKHTN